MTSRNPTMPELLNDATEAALEEVLTWMPAKVVRYDAATQQVDAQPIQKDRHFAEDGSAVVTTRPVVPGVPVQFPGGGGYTVTFPIEVGDVVILLFSGVSIDKWLRSSTDEPADPETHERHSPANAVAIPGVKNFARPRASAPTDHVRIGLDGASAQGAALGETLQTFLNSLRTAYNTHIHTDPVSGVTTAPTVLLGAVPDVASNTVKVTE